MSSSLHTSAVNLFLSSFIIFFWIFSISILRLVSSSFVFSTAFSWSPVLQQFVGDTCLLACNYCSSSCENVIMGPPIMMLRSSLESYPPQTHLSQYIGEGRVFSASTYTLSLVILPRTTYLIIRQCSSPKLFRRHVSTVTVVPKLPNVNSRKLVTE